MKKLSLVSGVSFLLMLVLLSPCYAAGNKKKAVSTTKTVSAASTTNAVNTVNSPSGGKSLFSAIKNYQLNIVKNLIKKGANVNAVDSNGNTPLICAAQTGNSDMVAVLLDAGVRVNAKNNNGSSAMDYAAEYATEANLEIIGMLERAGGRLNPNSVFVLNGLRKAINGNNYDFAKKLLDKGANVNAKFVNKEPFLFLAASKNNPDMVALLLNYDVNVDIGTDDIGTPLCAAIVGDIDEQDYSFLEFSENSLKIARLLINAGANVNKGSKNDNLTPLYWACAEKSCNPEMVVLLLESGADISKASVDNKSLFELTKTSEGNKININKYSQVMRILKNPKMFTEKNK